MARELIEFSLCIRPSGVAPCTDRILRIKHSFAPRAIVPATIAGLAFGLLAAIFPARQAAKMEIIQALRYE